MPKGSISITNLNYNNYHVLYIFTISTNLSSPKRSQIGGFPAGPKLSVHRTGRRALLSPIVIPASILISIEGGSLCCDRGIQLSSCCDCLPIITLHHVYLDHAVLSSSFVSGWHRLPVEVYPSLPAIMLLSCVPYLPAISQSACCQLGSFSTFPAYLHDSVPWECVEILRMRSFVSTRSLTQCLSLLLPYKGNYFRIHFRLG